MMFDWFKVFDYGIAAAILVVMFFMIRMALSYLTGTHKSNVSTYERFFVLIDTFTSRIETAITEISKSNFMLTKNLEILTTDTHKRLETIETDLEDIKDTVHGLQINQTVLTSHFDKRLDEMSK